MSKVNPMKSVFLVQHCYQLNGEDEIKTIGIFISKSDADRVVEMSKSLPGFSMYPDDFFIDEYELGKAHWAEGFVTVTPQGKMAKSKTHRSKTKPKPSRRKKRNKPA